ncbi:MAG: hypothetical protein AAF597_00410 [Bacteroidota bacterium]
MYRKLFLALLFVGALSVTAAAQTTEDEARQDLDYYSSSADRDLPNAAGEIWWGTGAILGFNSNNFESIFRIGLTPIVGYKINNFLSVGPRGSLVYTAYRQSFGNGVPDFKSNFLEWSVGPFARAKVFNFGAGGNQIFVHAEYNLTNEVNAFDANNDPIRRTRAIPFLGGGLSQGGGPGAPGFEILVLFRLSSADQIGDRPFELRTGLNFNF